MICALSPASDNYQETLSTLVRRPTLINFQRYADQAKQIKLNATVNENETDKLIRDLKAENLRLLSLIDQNGVSPNNMELQRVKELEALLFMNKQKLLESEEDFQKQLLAAKARGVRDSIDCSIAWLENLNEDPHLNGKVKYSLFKGIPPN